MPISVILTEKAQEDLDDAYQWYEDQEPGLGKEFIRKLIFSIIHSEPD